jgi:predicted O-linked N-acetylglucosamine transferase (SPINDLY family)
MPPVSPPQRPDEEAAGVSVAEAFRRALDACQRGAWPEAERICRLILDAQPRHFDALHLLGTLAMQAGRAQEAADLLSSAIEANPRVAQAHMTRAAALRALGRHAEAREGFEQAASIAPDSPEAQMNLGIALADLGRQEDALACQERAIALRPGFAEAHYNRGVSLQALGRLEEALESYDRAIAAKPGLAGAHNNRGVVLRDLGRLAEALSSYDAALSLDPRSAEAHNNRGVVLRALRRPADAVESYGRAIAIRPAFAQAHRNLGAALGDLGRPAEALQHFDRAIALDPAYADAQVARGVALRDLGRHAEARDAFARALSMDPGFEWLEGLWLHAAMRVCDWSGLQDRVDHLVRRVERGERATHPFPLLALPGDAALQRKAAETWVAARHPRRDAPPATQRRGPRDRIRIGYFSADYFEHATSYLVAGLFEMHDRASFEITAFSFGPDTRDDMRRRIAAGVDRFVDVRAETDEEIVRLARNHGIDIAVDLKGFTEDARTGIFERRAAPVQVSYLGYPGTMGAGFMDYAIADDTTIPEEHGRHYAEKIVRLPHSYQANDSARRISARRFTRREAGLPEEGFVFCCFNNNFKFLPATFDAWMRLLDRVKGSVLWLLQDSEAAADSLRAEAARRGIAPARLVFAKRLPVDEHLARHRLADLFLDTLPYNAHTTASDALWAGLPVVTCLGDTFAGRVAASLLRATGLPELVAETPERYEALALALAADRGRLAGLRRRLEEARGSAPLFDTRAFTRHLEAAFATMDARCQAGLPPESFRVPA